MKYIQELASYLIAFGILFLLLALAKTIQDITGLYWWLMFAVFAVFTICKRWADELIEAISETE